MRRFVLGFFALATAIGLANSAHAGAITNLVPNVINELEDENFEAFFPSDDFQGVLVPGDRFLGVIRVQDLDAPPGGTTEFPGLSPTFTAAFAIEVARVVENAMDGLGNVHDFVYYKPIGETDWNTAFGLTAGTIPLASSLSTIIQVWDDVLPGDTNDETGNLSDSVATFVGANKVYEFGFQGTLGADGITDQGEFFITHGGASTSIPGSDLSSIINVISLNTIARFNGAPGLAPHTHLDGGTFDVDRAEEAGADFGVASDFQAFGGIQNSGDDSDFGFATDTNAFISPIPEPTSLALFSLGGLAIGAYGARRRKQQTAA